MVESFKIFMRGSVLVCLAGCSSVSKFEKFNGTSGYSVRELSGKTHFEVSLSLPQATSERTKKMYAWRAIGEECLQQGFEYFDIADATTEKYVGFCFPSNERKSLAVSFKQSGLQENPKRFIVEDLNNKSSTLLLLEDELLKIGDQKLTSMSQIKNLVFELMQKSNAVPLTIKRNGRDLKVSEPIALMKGGLLGKAELENLRREAP